MPLKIPPKETRCDGHVVHSYNVFAKFGASAMLWDHNDQNKIGYHGAIIDTARLFTCISVDFLHYFGITHDAVTFLKQNQGLTEYGGIRKISYKDPRTGSTKKALVVTGSLVLSENSDCGRSPLEIPDVVFELRKSDDRRVQIGMQVLQRYHTWHKNRLSSASDHLVLYSDGETSFEAKSRYN